MITTLIKNYLSILDYIRAIITHLDATKQRRPKQNKLSKKNEDEYV